MNVADARLAVHEACLQMVADGLVIGSAGDISVPVDEHHFVVTAAGVPYDQLTAADHPPVDGRSGELDGPRRPTVLVTEYAPPGSGDLGSQALAGFRRQPDSRAVLLADHGVVAIGPTLAAAGTGEHVLDRDVQDAIARNDSLAIAGPEHP